MHRILVLGKLKVSILKPNFMIDLVLLVADVLLVLVSVPEDFVPFIGVCCILYPVPLQADLATLGAPYRGVNYCSHTIYYHLLLRGLN